MKDLIQKVGFFLACAFMTLAVWVYLPLWLITEILILFGLVDDNSRWAVLMRPSGGGWGNYPAPGGE